MNMNWIDKGNYCIHPFLTNLGVPHAVSTRKMGNLKNSTNQSAFLELLKKDGIIPKTEDITYKKIFIGEQKHTANYFEINTPSAMLTPLSRGEFQNNDGFYSRLGGVGMGVFTADCMPVFVVIPNRKIVGLFHAGWKGVYHDIVGKFLIDIRNAKKYIDSDDYSDIFVVIGPHLKSCCYEVGQEFNRDFGFELEERSFMGEKKFFLDMQKNLKKKLESIGIKSENIMLSNLCTGCERDLFFSYRYDNKTDDRMLSTIWNVRQ